MSRPSSPPPARRSGPSGAVLAWALALLMTLSACGSRVSGEEGPVATARDGALRVAAAASLTDLAADLNGPWEAAARGPVRLQLAASSTLARQLVEGAPADLFLTADGRWIDALEADGRPVLERRAWLMNRLVLVVPDDAPDPDPAALRSLAVGAEGVPVGRYARQALQGMGWPLPPRVVAGHHARDVLAKVAEGAAEAGIVYRTDVILEPRVRVVQLLPITSHEPVVYQAALLSEAGRPLLEALTTPEAHAEAEAAGFDVLP